MTNTAEQNALTDALQWHLDNGVDEAIADTPVDKTKPKEMPKATPKAEQPAQVTQTTTQSPQEMGVKKAAPLMGGAEAIQRAAEVANAATTLEELKQAIADFDGLAIKKTATNMVFADGNPNADIMVVGEAPGADEDMQGKPFVGQSGQLLDLVFKSIGLSRDAEDAKNALYISNIVNWRPPGNRTPTQAESDISLPFIEKHIQLIQPKMLVLCGGVSTKALLGTNDAMSKLRGTFHPYEPRTNGIDKAGDILALATYHPAYLLRSPGQKRQVWMDMILLQEKREELGLV